MNPLKVYPCILNGTTNCLLYIGFISFREGSILPPPRLLFSLTLLPSPLFVSSEQAGCVRVCQGIWNNVKVNKQHTQTRTLTHTWVHRMSEWNVKTIIFQRKLEVSNPNSGIDLYM